MDNELLIRLYNVGLGDCIYLRIPDGAETRHVLIDCGNKYGTDEELIAAIEDLKTQLGPAGKLDLLVATHAHEDHIRGFDAALLGDIKIDRIWLSVAMDPEHPQAPKLRALQGFTQAALAGLRLSVSPALSELAASLLSLSKGDGLEALRDELPKLNQIEPAYVHADTPQADLDLFAEDGLRFRVLAPMADIDGFYLGEEFDALDDYLGFAPVFGVAEMTAPLAEESAKPTNIGEADFRRLQQRLQSNALAFALEEGHLINNTSLVLLLEWRGRRLLFTGDAERKTAWAGDFTPGTSNGSWNVMRKHQGEQLAEAVDFLKVGHHGSENATPWTTRTLKVGHGAGRSERPHPINEILDDLLPPPAAGAEPRAVAVVSTERSGYKSIPDPALMQELGRRVANRKRYTESTSSGTVVPPDVPQPQRTDLEWQVADAGRRYVDVRFTPAAGWHPRPERRTDMRVEVGSKIEFTYTDKSGTTELWKGRVTRAEPGKEFFKVNTGDPFPRTFRYDRVEGEINVLTHA